MSGGAGIAFLVGFLLGMIFTAIFMALAVLKDFGDWFK